MIFLNVATNSVACATHFKGQAGRRSQGAGLRSPPAGPVAGSGGCHGLGRRALWQVQRGLHGFGGGGAAWENGTITRLGPDDAGGQEARDAA